MTVAHIDHRTAVDYPPTAQQSVLDLRSMRLVEWAEEARAANLLAQSLCKTAFAGAWKGDVDGGTACILKGSEVGLTPVTALGAFDNIQGAPAPKAITLRALVQSFGHSVWIEKSTDTECVAKARRKGETETHVSKWTVDRARRLGLTNKDNWKKQPEAMLVARATSEVCRMVAADVILGIGYSVEELQDMTEDTPKRTAQRQTAQRAPKVTATVVHPESSGEMPEPDFEQPDIEHIDPAKYARDKRERQMFALFHETKHDDEDDQRAYIETVIGHPLGEHRTDITDDELSAVIAELQVEKGATS